MLGCLTNFCVYLNPRFLWYAFKVVHVHVIGKPTYCLATCRRCVANFLCVIIPVTLNPQLLPHFQQTQGSRVLHTQCTLDVLHTGILSSISKDAFEHCLQNSAYLFSSACLRNQFLVNATAYKQLVVSCVSR